MTEPTQSGGSGSGFDFNQPTIIAICYLASFVVGITGIIGIVLAHVWQSDNDEAWAASHFTYLIRTFWFGFLAFIIAGILTVVVIGVFLIPLIMIWVIVRSVMSLLKAQKKEPMPDPQTMLF